MRSPCFSLSARRILPQCRIVHDAQPSGVGAFGQEPSVIVDDGLSLQHKQSSLRKGHAPWRWQSRMELGDEEVLPAHLAPITRNISLAFVCHRAGRAEKITHEPKRTRFLGPGWLLAAPPIKAGRANFNPERGSMYSTVRAVCGCSCCESGRTMVGGLRVRANGW